MPRQTDGNFFCCMSSNYGDAMLSVNAQRVKVVQLSEVTEITESQLNRFCRLENVLDSDMKGALRGLSSLGKFPRRPRLSIKCLGYRQIIKFVQCYNGTHCSVFFLAASESASIVCSYNSCVLSADLIDN